MEKSQNLRKILKQIVSMVKVKVNLGRNSYNILIGRGVVRKFIPELKNIGLEKYQPVIVTNEHIFRLHSVYIKKSLSSFYPRVLFLKVPDSERSKSWRIFSQVLENVVEYDQGKNIFLIALGGGVVGDLTGFLAAVYKRGIPYVQVPTTLLAQVDSSIGGKVALDLKYGKNLIGAFYQPKLVLSDLEFLRTLPPRELRNGLSEIIKYGIIKSLSIFTLLERKKTEIYNWDLQNWLNLVSKCVKIKAAIVKEDELDNRDIRIVLNFGHTIAHALESASSYKTISHGEAVALGMLVESTIACRIGLLEEDDYQRIRNLILELDCLPVFKRRLTLLDIMKHLPYDKKSKFGKLRFVLPRTIGKVEVKEQLPHKIIVSSLREVLKNVYNKS